MLHILWPFEFTDFYFLHLRKYLKGNQFENLKKENNISEKYLAKQGKASLQLEKYADKEGYIIGE